MARLDLDRGALTAHLTRDERLLGLQRIIVEVDAEFVILGLITINFQVFILQLFSVGRPPWHRFHCGGLQSVGSDFT